MSQSIQEDQSSDNARTEYNAVAKFHSALLNSRFTIAGLYVAAIGFFGGALIKPEITWGVRAIGATFAIWLTLCLWILELRTRAIFSNIVHRGIEIEHEVWNLVDENWYTGFFSRQYKEPPNWNHTDPLPRRLDPDRPTLGWGLRPMSPKLSRLINHSMGLDLLYAGSSFFWLGTLIISLLGILIGW